MSWNNITPWEVIFMQINEHLARQLCGFPSEIYAGRMRDDVCLDP